MLIGSRKGKAKNRGESVKKRKKWIQNSGNIKYSNYPDNLVVDVEGLASEKA